jgi:ArsR family transcriptional regulator, arsenate/arsenite/antimonite-responsive transcriptional repressor
VRVLGIAPEAHTPARLRRPELRWACAGSALFLLAKLVSSFIEMSEMTSKLQRHAEQLAALGSPVRLAIVRHVVQGDAEGTVVGDIQARLDIPWATLSHHLERLSSAGLLKSRPEGKFVYYRAELDALRALTEYLWEDCCRGGAKTCC